MNYEKLAELLFGDIKYTPEYYENKYKTRELCEGAQVTRFAPSPTGFMHLGNLYGSLVDERIATKSNGVFYLRIEDTDHKRSVEGGVEAIIDALASFGLNFTEGVTKEGSKGEYGPYKQSEREEIYKAFAKELVKKGRAYPCFCTEEQLAEMRKSQESTKENYGYYGKWAKHRDMSFEEIVEQLSNKTPYVLRFKSSGNIKDYTEVHDLVRGVLKVPQNDQDHVLLKQNGIPTYHFAHVVDDHLMRTTCVVRGEEWLSTLPLHIELFSALNFCPPSYIHTSHIMKLDVNGKRKLSKRKDKEAALTYYNEMGYPYKCVIEYLMTLLNSNFEEWRNNNLNASINEFPFSIEKLSISGALFDIEKLNDISKNYISRLTAKEVYDDLKIYAQRYDSELLELLQNEDYILKILNIGRGGEKPRRDITYYSEVKSYISFFFDSLYKLEAEYPQNIQKDVANKILTQFLESYNEQDTQEQWFEKITKIAVDNGFAAKTKDYKKNPELYKGHIGDVSSVIRIAVTGRQNSPDMYVVMQILGKDCVVNRLKAAISN